MSAEIATNVTVGLLSGLYNQIDPIRLAEMDRSLKIASEYGERIGKSNLKPVQRLHPGVLIMSHSGDLFWALLWLFFMLSSLQPLLQQRMLEAARQRKIARFERKRGSRVIVMVHRQETMRLLGFPIVRYIDINDSEEVLRAIRLTDADVPIDLIIHTPGGLVLAALQIVVRVLRLFHRQILGERDDAKKLRTETLQPAEIHLS